MHAQAQARGLPTLKLKANTLTKMHAVFADCELDTSSAQCSLLDSRTPLSTPSSPTPHIPASPFPSLPLLFASRGIEPLNVAKINVSCNKN